MSTVSVVLNDQMKEALQSSANKNGMSLSKYIRAVLALSLMEPADEMKLAAALVIAGKKNADFAKAGSMMKMLADDSENLVENNYKNSENIVKSNYEDSEKLVKNDDKASENIVESDEENSDFVLRHENEPPIYTLTEEQFNEIMGITPEQAAADEEEMRRVDEPLEPEKPKKLSFMSKAKIKNMTDEDF